MRHSLAGAVSFGLLLVIVNLAGPALADVQKSRDPRDSGGKLDVVRVEHGHGQPKHALRHTLVMRQPWQDSALRGRSVVYVFFSTDREPRFSEYRARIDYENGQLVASIMYYDHGGDYVGMGEPVAIQVARVGRRSVTIEFARSLFPENVRRYGWYATSEFKSNGPGSCSDVLCYDEAPNGQGVSRVVHSLGAAPSDTGSDASPHADVRLCEGLPCPVDGADIPPEVLDDGFDPTPDLFERVDPIMLSIVLAIILALFAVGVGWRRRVADHSP